jgi:hypothetical protein
MSSLAARLAEVHSRIDQACAIHARKSSDVELIIVTKNHPVDLAIELLGLGERNFGENRDQEASAKAAHIQEVMPENLPTWHFVGQLQSNKVRSMLSYSSYLHSLDRQSLLAELAKQLGKDPQRRFKVFIELNLTDDSNRGGISPTELLGFAEQVLAVGQIELMGVMGVAGLDVEPERDFERIALASLELQKLDPSANYISAGMSGDFETAIGFGATHIRVGTAITGKR